MLTLSPARTNVPLLEGLTLLHRGKVRDSYALDDHHMLIYATDAISIFDVVLNSLIPQKGMILTAMSHFWLMYLENIGIKTHLVAVGPDIDKYLPVSLRGNPDLQTRSMVVHRLRMIPVEFIARGFLTGTGLTSYLGTGFVCGHKLPPGLQDGDELSTVIDTPTTKANRGHDLPLNAEMVRAEYPEETAFLLEIYSYISKFTRERCGIILADTKLEFGRDKDDRIILADEVGTPDSSRYWELSQWAVGRSRKKRVAPVPFDKQMVREWGKEQNLSPMSEVPVKLIQETARTYREIFWWLTRMKLETYQQRELRINFLRVC